MTVSSASPDRIAGDALRTPGWPASARWDHASDQLLLHKTPVRDLVARYGSPLIAYDRDEIIANITRVGQAFPFATTYFAAKSLPLKDALRTAYRYGARIDVCSEGELTLALRAGVPGEALLFHGNNKSEIEIRRAIESGVGYFVSDAIEDLAAIARQSAVLGQASKVLLRVKVGITSATHKNIATAHQDQKFGFVDDDRPSGLTAAIEFAHRLPLSNLLGFTAISGPRSSPSPTSPTA